MSKRPTLFFALSGLLVLLTGAAFSQQADSLAKRIGHYDPKAYPTREGIHAGAGSMAFGNLVDVKYVQGNWVFFQRGVLNPHSSIGEHFHLATEEMFVIFDGDAQFTMDGRSAVVKAPAAVPVRLGHEHAVYNPTDRPMQWMNISVSVKKGASGAFNLGDRRVDAVLDAIPQFISMRFDRSLLKPIEHMNGGTGAVQYRRALQPSIFSTPWAYVDHLLLIPGASAGPASQADISEIYYVMKGAGSVTVDRETAPIKEGDGIPVDMGQTRSFTQSGAEPLEMLVVGVARDMTVKGNMTDSARGGEAPKTARQ
jgi:mannose-6-phosphate isomerase-like protein (cupin superfamily)